MIDWQWNEGILTDTCPEVETLACESQLHVVFDFRDDGPTTAQALAAVERSGVLRFWESPEEDIYDV